MASKSLIRCGAMRIHSLGVRGSTGAPGARFVRYGGHTSCLAIAVDGRRDPHLVLDAGTGLRSLNALLAGRPYSGSILLSHLHWDHVQGLPFFAAGDRDDARVTLHIPGQLGTSARDLLALNMSPPSFPITPEGLRGDWSFDSIEPGDHVIEGFKVVVTDVAHKGGRTFAYRVEDGGGAMAYLPDHAPAAGVSEETWALINGVDVLVHDAQFVDAERAIADAYGHATVDDAIALATKADARLLLLFHHSPARTDDELDALARAVADAPIPVRLAREGDEIDVSSTASTPTTRSSRCPS